MRKRDEGTPRGGHSHHGLLFINKPNMRSNTLKGTYKYALVSILFAVANGVNAQWTQTNAPTGMTFNCFASFPGEIYAGSTSQGGVYFSTDDGATWNPTFAQPPNSIVYAIANVGNYTYIGTLNGIYYATSYGGGGWVADTSGLTTKWVTALTSTGSDVGSYMFAGTEYSGVFLSTNNGASWHAVNSGLGDPNITCLAVSSSFSSSATIYAGTQGGFYYSTNYGTTWTQLNTGLTSIGITALAAEGNEVFAGTINGAFVLVNYTSGWKVINSGLPTGRVNSLVLNGSSLIAGVNEGVFVLMDGTSGNAWIPQNSGLPGPESDCVFVGDGYLLSSYYGIQRYPLSIFPELVSVKNVPFTEGGSVELTWTASSLDTNVYDLPYYSIWRAISPVSGITEKGTTLGGTVNTSTRLKRIRIVTTSEGTFAFQWVGEDLAHRLSTYSYAAPTLSDSMAGTNGMEYFMVSAQTNNANVFYDSNIDSGYSVDMLAPAAPKSLTATVFSGTVTLHWLPNTESDLKDYVIYRSDSTIENTKSLTPYATTVDTAFTDTSPLASTVSYYAVCAEDVHGNLSAASNQISATVTGIDGPDNNTPKEFSLSQNYPNPFNPTTVISYKLSALSNVTLKVYDVLGREVATLVNERQNAGNYSVAFDGSKFASGIYFYRLVAGNVTATKKLVLIK